MKAIYFTAGLFFIMSFGGFAQEFIPQNNSETTDQTVIGGFFSFDNKLSTLHGANVWFSGGTFGIVIDHQMRIGLGGYSLKTKSMFDYANPAEDYKEYLLNNELGYFGLAFEYVFFPDAPVHITIPVLLAGGSAKIKQEVPLNQLSFPDPQGIESTYWALVEKSNLAVIEPGINIELEILPWMRLDLGTSYRFVLGSELESILNSDRNLSGASFHAGLKFSCF
jgi:hypothetical protein